MRKNIYWAAGLTALYLLLDISLARQVTLADTLFSVVFSFCGFLLFSVVCSSLYVYRYLMYAVPVVSLLALLPVLNFFYYKTYTEFISYQFLQILLREPVFLLTTVCMQTLPYAGYVLPALIIWCFIAHKLLRPLFNAPVPPCKPFAVYSHIIPAVLLPAGLVGCYLTLPPLYKIPVCAGILTAALLIPFLWFIWKTARKPVQLAVTVCCILIGLGAVYKMDSTHLRLGAATLITALDTLYIPATPNDMAQSEQTLAAYKQLTPPDIPFNVLIIINDGMRARNLGIYGYTERYPDQALQPFYQKSEIFRYALSPAHYTTLSIGQIFTAQGADRSPKQIKEARRLWDFAPADVFTFYVFSANKTWGNLDKFISSVHMDHLWSFAQEDDDLGSLLEMMDDTPAINHTQELITQHPRYIGVLHTNNTHFPFYQNPAVTPRYRPCSASVKSGWPQTSVNCYDNAIRHVANEEAFLLEHIDLSNTVVVITADHGQQFKEHGGYFYAALYDENIHVPFIWYIPPGIQQKIPAQNWQSFKKNTEHYVGNIDILPTILHLAALVTREPDVYTAGDFSGHSLFEPRQNDYVVVSSGCFMDWACVKRETVFADDNYYVLFKPNKRHPLEIYPARDTAQQTPLSIQDISPEKLQNIYDKAPQVHPLGTVLQLVLEKQFPQLATPKTNH